MSMTLGEFRAMALSYPGVGEHPSHGGRPSFEVRKKFLAWLREDDVLAMRVVDLVRKQFLLETQPDVYFTTDHYTGYPAVLLRLSKADPEDVREIFEETWRERAPRKLIAAYESGQMQPS